MSIHNQIDLVEFPADAATLAAARSFYENAFGWSFTDYGGEYLDTPDSGVVAGFNAVVDDQRQRMPMAVVYVTDLEAGRERVVASGGRIIHDIYPFPGGRRFHFEDPAGNELAVWSDPVASD